MVVKNHRRKVDDLLREFVKSVTSAVNYTLHGQFVLRQSIISNSRSILSKPRNNLNRKMNC